MNNIEGRFYFNALCGFISIGSLTLFIKHQFRAFKINQERKQAFNSQEYSPDQLQRAIEFQIDYIKNNFFQSKEDVKNGLIRGKIFLAGIVQANNPIYSSHYKGIKNIPLIYKIKYDQEVYSLDVQDPNIKTYTTMDFPENTEFQKLRGFALKDPIIDNKYGYIQLENDTDVSSCLQYMGSIDKFRWRGLGERIAGFLLLVIKLIVQIILGKDNAAIRSMRGIKLGIRETEIGIKVDTPLLAYGEVIYDFATNTCRMESPIALAYDKMQYIKKINFRLNEEKWKRNVFGIIFASTAIYFLRRFWHYQQRINQIKSYEKNIDIIWEKAQHDSKEQCPKKEKQGDELSAWLDQNEGKIIPKPCLITPQNYNNNGSECVRCYSQPGPRSQRPAIKSRMLYQDELIGIA